MSERFGIPDHAPPHAPDHAAQNPTAQGSWDFGGGEAADWPAPSQPTGGGARSGPYLPIQVDPHKSVKTGIVLAMILGPLGLFYVSFLNGVAALFVVIPLARWLTFLSANALGGRVELVWVALAIMWCITVPWAVAGVLRHNRKVDR